jgi:hypothetical protein
LKTVIQEPAEAFPDTFTQYPYPSDENHEDYIIVHAGLSVVDVGLPVMVKVIILPCYFDDQNIIKEK